MVVILSCWGRGSVAKEILDERFMEGLEDKRKRLVERSWRQSDI